MDSLESSLEAGIRQWVKDHPTPAMAEYKRVLNRVLLGDEDALASLPAARDAMLKEARGAFEGVIDNPPKRSIIGV